jgi:hypothetical protein
METMRKLGVAAMMGLALSFAACTSNTPTPGVVTGTAQACAGSAPGELAPSHVKVQLYSGSTLVASETVPAGSDYRFSVAPGSYQVEGWWGSKAVVVRAGHVVTRNILNMCV